MKNELMHVSGAKTLGLPVDAGISLMPYIKCLEKRLQEEKSLKASFFHSILEYFRTHDLPQGDISLDDINQYGDFFEYIYASLSPALISERNVAWGISFPLVPRVFYGTDLLYELLEAKPTDTEDNEVSRAIEDYKTERLHAVYTLILQRLYNFEVPVKIKQIHSWMHQQSGLLRYYEVTVNADFVEVTAKGELPVLDFVELYNHFTQDNGHLLLEKALPLDLFQFRGFAVLNVADVTARMAVENIARLRLNRTPGNSAERYRQVLLSLKTLVQNSHIEFDLFPFVRVNNEAVYGYEQAGTGILFSIWGEQRLSPEAFRKQAEGYASNPNSFFSPDIHREDEMAMAFLTPFRDANVESLALIPLFFDQTLVGVLGMHTWRGESFDEKTLALLDPAFAPIAQLLQIYIDEFNLELGSIIREKYTSIQPSVQWKFNESAWHSLHRKKKNLPEVTENIHFDDVYPLYGAIDIRNSTLERNLAIHADLDHHISLLDDTLTTLQAYDHSSLMKELRFNCTKWRQLLAQGDLNSTGEGNLNAFLTEDTREYLVHLSRENPATEPVVKGFLEAVHPASGHVNRHRRELEETMLMINTAVNNYFESEKDTLQESYPCYFEKFRTDGIEYDIYIGQSISPKKPFNHFHLKNLRLWQLSSMIAVARLTQQLQAATPKQLKTTQLIFVHNHMIDISFRADERKFDVEGAYNIRYQMIKKRIDKVHIRDTDERLTQPDTIALIYFHERDLDDYLPFIRFLQETNSLDSKIERLELEDLQGLSGLRALRLGVIYPEPA
jgi:hypothetical protein